MTRILLLSIALLSFTACGKEEAKPSVCSTKPIQPLQIIDKLEDPYDLYSEDEVVEEKTLAETIKEEKKKGKANRRSIYQTIKDTKAALSFYRLGAYALLILGFLYLNRQGLLHIPSYILSLGLPSVILVWVLLKEKENQTQD